MAEGDVVLVKAREAKMVNFCSGDSEPTSRTGHFLSPFARFSHETASPVFQYSSPAISPQGVRFRGWCYPVKRWGEWVKRMEAAHGEEWDDAGIRVAIKASTWKVKRQPELVWALLDHWCLETNTFVFQWGEATPTLEDVAVLGGLPLLGEPAKMMGPMAAKLVDMSERVARELKCLTLPYHAYWLSRFMDEAEGADKELEHIAFLSFWLSRFVFPGPTVNCLGRHVFPVAIRLAWGERIALAPAVLAGLYRDLHLLKKHSISCRKGEAPEATDCAVFSPFQLLQLWLWERFVSLRPEAGPPRRLPSFKPRVARWHGLAKKNLDISYVKSILNSPEEFQWRPYAINLDKKRQPCFYKDVGEWVHGSSAEDEELVSFSRCLAPCELVGLDCIEQYLPHRVAMQFGLAQDLPGGVPRVDHSWEQAWATYDKSVYRIKFYVPPRLMAPSTTLKYQLWWRIHVSPCSYAALQRQSRCPEQDARSSKKIPPRKGEEKSAIDFGRVPLLDGLNPESYPPIDNERHDVVCRCPGSTPCVQENLPSIDGKRKRGRPRKLPTILSSANENGRPRLLSPPPLIKKKKKRRSRKLSTLLYQLNECLSSTTFSPLGATCGRKCGRPRLSPKFMKSERESIVSCQHAKEIGMMKRDFAGESLAVAVKVNAADIELSHDRLSMDYPTQFKIVYKRREVSKPAATSGVIDMEASGDTKHVNTSRSGTSAHSEMVTMEDAEVTIPVRHGNDENIALPELKNSALQNQENDRRA